MKQEIVLLKMSFVVISYLFYKKSCSDFKMYTLLAPTLYKARAGKSCSIAIRLPRADES